jgi:predicted amidophosphoribosyltransferase
MMAGWEALQQGAPDPFFAKGRPGYLGVYCKRCKQDAIPINGRCPWCGRELKSADDPARVAHSIPPDPKEPS